MINKWKIFGQGIVGGIIGFLFMILLFDWMKGPSSVGKIIPLVVVIGLIVFIIISKIKEEKK